MNYYLSQLLLNNYLISGNHSLDRASSFKGNLILIEGGFLLGSLNDIQGESSLLGRLTDEGIVLFRYNLLNGISSKYTLKRKSRLAKNDSLNLFKGTLENYCLDLFETQSFIQTIDGLIDKLSIYKSRNLHNYLVNAFSTSEQCYAYEDLKEYPEIVNLILTRGN